MQVIVTRGVALPLLIVLTFAGCQSEPPLSRENGWLRAPENIPAEPDACSIKPAAAIANTAEAAPVPVPEPSQESADNVLTLADLEAIAFENNPTLARAAARTASAEGRQVQAGLYPNPVLGYHATDIGTKGTSGANGGFVLQKFITGGKLGLSQAVAEREVVATQFELQAQEQRVLNDVRVRFYEAMIARRRVKLTEELTTIGENLVKAAGALLENRQGTENDLLQAEIRAENARILHENAQNESREAWRRMAAVIGNPHLPESELAGDIQEELPTYEWETSLEMLLACHPDVQAALARVERTGIAIQRARREPIPNVDLFVSVRHQDLTKDEIATIQAGIPVPIFDRNQGNIRSAEAEWIAARNDVQRIELELQDRLAVTFRRYANARQQVQKYRETIIPRAERSLKLVTEGYEKGQVAYLTLLTAQQTYLEVTLANLDSLRELRVSSALIEGLLLTDSLSVRK